MEADSPAPKSIALDMRPESALFESQSSSSNHLRQCVVFNTMDRDVTARRHANHRLRQTRVPCDDGTPPRLRVKEDLGGNFRPTTTERILCVHPLPGYCTPWVARIISVDSSAERSMKSFVVKRSIAIVGHKTSVSLEDAFWKTLKGDC
jgi:hypothetical protein